MRETLPYGLWPSPISPDSLAQSLRLSDVGWDSDGQTLVWLEGRSDRGVLVALRLDGGAARDLTTGSLSVRARVGYGGGDFALHDGTVYFVENSGRIYRQSLLGGQAQPITPAFGHAAAPTPSPDGKWLVYVHTYEGEDTLAVADSEGAQWPQQLVGGHDFFMQPTWHPQGTMLAWVAWNNPLMPWDGTELYLSKLDYSSGSPRIVDPQKIAGGENTAIFQPAFSPDGSSLAYVSDQSGWGNLYLYDLASGESKAITNEQAELGAPAWVQGERRYGWADPQTIYFLRNEQGFHTMQRLDVASGKSEPVAALDEYTYLDQPAIAPTGDRLAVLASAATTPSRVVSLELATVRATVRARSSGEDVAAAQLSQPQAISWPTAGAATAYGLYYPPINPQYQSGGKPPLIVLIHGGPTSQVAAAYSGQTQFFATRGYGVLWVNYRGSTGYGRPYMEALRGTWGVVDVEDAISGAHHLRDAGLVDGEKLVIMGGSAGGYTVLQVLAHHPGAFKAGINLFGLANLFTFVTDTHKFEARYLDSLIGTLPEDSKKYRERSPLFYADQISDPLAVFQGEIDTVVPRNQSDVIVAALQRRGVPHEYHVYAGEGHGWRKTETIATFYAAVDKFLREYVLFA